MIQYKRLGSLIGTPATAGQTTVFTSPPDKYVIIKEFLICNDSGNQGRWALSLGPGNITDRYFENLIIQGWATYIFEMSTVLLPNTPVIIHYAASSGFPSLHAIFSGVEVDV